MAFSAFVKIDGIEGESTDDLHPKWIEILEYGTIIKQKISSTASSAGGATAERADFSGFTFRKQSDKASPLLCLACAAGTHINTVEIEICRAATDIIKFMTYRLTNCIISQIINVGGVAFPYDTVTVDFGKIEYIYTRQNRAGGVAAGNIATGWDLQRNCRI